MDQQINFLSIIATALNTYIEQQISNNLQATLQAKIDEAVGDKITELFSDKIGELISEKMTEAIETAIDRHVTDETHGADPDEVADAIFDSYTAMRKFKGVIDEKVAELVDEALDNHCNEFDHSKLDTDLLTESEVDGMITDAITEHTNDPEHAANTEAIDERVREALKHLTVRVEWGNNGSI